MTIRRRLFQIVSLLTVLTMLLAGLSLPSASAQGGDGLQRQRNSQTGRVSFLSPESGGALPAARALGTSARPQDPALALVKRFGPEFGLHSPERDLTEMQAERPEDGRVIVRYQQNYRGVPVLGGEMIVNTNREGDLYSINGEVSPELSLETEPSIDAQQARQAALEAMAKWYETSVEAFVASEPALWIYDESLLRPSTRPAELVWRMEVTSADGSLPVRELVLVNARRGSISLHFNQVDTAWAVQGRAGAVQEPDATPTPLPTETPSVTVTPELVITETPIEEIVPGEEALVPDPTVPEGAILAAATWYVATTGNDSNSCSVPAAPCKTINGALAKAAGGDEIRVADGSYYGSGGNVVTISKNITLSGGWTANFSAQTGVSTIDGQNARNGILSTNAIVTVRRFVVQNATSSDSGGIYVYGGSFTLENSTLRQNHAEN